MLKPIPANLKTDFLTETRSDALPTITRDGENVLYPAFIRAEQTTDEGGNVHTEYRFFIVPVPYTGQNIDDEETFALESYAALRKHFYGPQEVQAELRDDHAWEAHRQAVRSAFPRYIGEPNPALDRFAAIKKMFWDTVDDVLKSVSKTRADLPPYFNDDAMIEWATANNVPAEVIATATAAFMRVSQNLSMNDRNWIELFDNE